LRYVLDASVAVAAIRNNEPSHAQALARCMAVSTGADEIIVPSIFEVEVVAALVRRGAPRSLAARFLEEHFGARNVVTLGPRAARSASRLAALARLRAADAIYVWLAAREDVPLVTLNNEVVARAPSVGVSAVTP
jgi:predicted nucleic acid-binding protein